jgi:hypothetical protein
MPLRAAARRYGTSVSTLRRRDKEGRIRVAKRGGRTLVDVAIADAFFDGLPSVKSRSLK